MARPIAFIGKCVAWISAGFTDRIVSRVSGGDKVSFAKHITARLYECEPWTDHLERSTAIGIDAALADQDYGTARALVGLGAKETANPLCINLALMAIDLIAEGCELTFETFICLE